MSWFPRLCDGTPQERNNWELLGGGVGVHWPDLDEDLSVAGTLIGGPSGESARSLGGWLLARRQGRGVTLWEMDEYEHEQRRKTMRRLGFD